ncbi:preprotein translocase subunit SecA [Planctellipticum variicoloris]|uniref:preprotein translocase subunit SecA n=1 Tax=Planctellipticum variicoloris TaxID=3064265 RepID=UPI0030133750|nr:preprotein translocase subunit SecA [Planctomycetaceae bacterium SH412]
MEFLEKIGVIFSTVLATIERFVTGLFGSSNERRVRQIGFVRDKKTGEARIVPGSPLDKINKLEPAYEQLSDDELRQTASRLRARLAKGETLDDLLPDAFAAVREAGKRYLKMRHYDVQMVGGYILHKGMIAEMVTGEGKTLVATLPTFLNALAGNVQVITVNDYLARRDMEWMGPTYMGLGLTVGAIQSNMPIDERKKAYDCDITYGTNNEFGFDYLRDNMKPTAESQVQGKLVYAVIDEIDNILIDEARTPLIISGLAHDDVTKYPKADRIARQLKPGEHFEIKEKEHTCHLTEAGVRHAEELVGVESFYTAGNMEWPHLLDNSLKAHWLYKRDVHYVVEPTGEIVIIDEHTGRKMDGRQWSDGLHQAVEAKEGVRIKEETQTLATITLQNFFKLYKKLSGMTGTAMTEANEFWKIYKLDVLAVPTNRPTQRINHPDAIYRTMNEKWDAVIQEVKEVHATGRPVLVGTVSIESSEYLSLKLKQHGIKHNVLNAKYHEREAEIIAQAGRHNAVTISTNMAGRGTDIILGGNPEYMAWDELKQIYATRLDVPKSVWDETTKRIATQEGMVAEGRKVAELGGLHVVGTERHDSRRIDLQLRGRAGRQGDPGSSRFFLSLEDDLMRKFAGDWVKDWLTALGMQEGERIESRMVSNRIEAAQKKVEERHFDMRKHLLEYDEVMDEQRKRVYGYRQGILEGSDCRSLILEMIDRQLERWTKHFLSANYRWETVAEWASQALGLDIEPRDVQNMTREQAEAHIAGQAERQADLAIQEQIDENLPEDVADDRERNWNAMARWVNARFALNTNDRELKKIGLEGLQVYLLDRAREALARIDYSPLDAFLAPDWNQRSLVGWVAQQYAIGLEPDVFNDMTPEQAATFIRARIDELYRHKEVEFPVSVGMTNFMAERAGAGERYDREGLIRWASGRFNTHLDPGEVESKPRNDIARMLFELSQKFLARGTAIEQLNGYLDKAYGASNGVGPGANGAKVEHPVDPQGLQNLINWANAEFQASLDATELEKSGRDAVAKAVRVGFERRFRPELYQTERSLILEILDTAWKDHLYYMDHLRAGIGLVGYAQKDPKVEYRREGMRAFEQMWDRIGGQVTSAIFRIEHQSPEFVGSLWRISAATHSAPAAIEAEPQQQTTSSGSGSTGPGEVQAVETIRNFGDKVGRNDPCPCGSGKKYKKCCGLNS